MDGTLQEEFVMYYEDYKLEDIYEFNKKMLQYILLRYYKFKQIKVFPNWYNLYKCLTGRKFFCIFILAN
ncbi:MAG: hypothetical protein JHC31_07525 [Sulfurihydrogenibium sp.]|nr:hypothetical protein [Sulfurihydrogenibium sp.]